MQKRIYEIKNVHFTNKGAELMLIAVCNALNLIDKHACIALRPGKSASYEQRIRYEAYQKIGGTKSFLNWSWIAELIPVFLKRNLGLVTDKDLFGILDASGYAYGGDWNTAMLSHAAYQATLIKKMGGVYIALPQAFGIFDTVYKKKKIREFVDAADIIFARDKVSMENLQAAEVNLKKVHIFPDFTATVETIKTELPESKDYACIVPNSKMLSKMNRDSRKDQYVHHLENCVHHLRKKSITPFFLLHEHKNDRMMCEIVNSRIKNPVHIIDEIDPRKIKYILGHSIINISSRYHACISSLTLGVPTIGTSWSHKYEMLYSDFNVSELLITEYSQTENIIENILFNRDKISAVLVSNSTKLKLKINQMWSLVNNVISSKQ